MVVSVSRRTMLQRIALVLATLVGALTPAAPALALEAPAPAKGRTLKLFGRNWHTFARDRSRGTLARTGDRLSCYGELLTEPDGEPMGHFLAACFCPEVPAGFGNVAAVTMEMHTFTFPDGAIMGQGVAAPGGGGRFAVVGGTGKYAGARGFYTALQEPLEWGGSGRAEFVFALTD
ncbi:MAG TPA: hypothetical protein VNT75_08755 [Symbiobacteriaceae bacterium]|nr:hypothetical protein [Symbiobacteriaceae bacterium]